MVRGFAAQIELSLQRGFKLVWRFFGVGMCYDSGGLIGLN